MIRETTLTRFVSVRIITPEGIIARWLIYVGQRRHSRRDEIRILFVTCDNEDSVIARDSYHQWTEDCFDRIFCKRMLMRRGGRRDDTRRDPTLRNGVRAPCRNVETQFLRSESVRGRISVLRRQLDVALRPLRRRFFYQLLRRTTAIFTRFWGVVWTRPATRNVATHVCKRKRRGLTHAWYGR